MSTDFRSISVLDPSSRTLDRLRLTEGWFPTKHCLRTPAWQRGGLARHGAFAERPDRCWSRPTLDPCRCRSTWRQT